MSKIEFTDILLFLTECFPRAFVLKPYQPHQPLRIGIDRDIEERCPAINRSERNVVLRLYTSRVMYLQSLVEGASRIDLNGNACGEVSATDAERAAARLTEIMAAREARRIASQATRHAQREAAKQAATTSSASASTSAPTVVKRPTLTLPAFRKAVAS